MLNKGKRLNFEYKITNFFNYILNKKFLILNNFNIIFKLLLKKIRLKKKK